MSTIKLGNKTLGNLVFGGVKIGDGRNLTKQKVFRTQALKNHGDKQITYSNNVVSDGIGTGGFQQPVWILTSSNWNDNGVWFDNANWND